MPIFLLGRYYPLLLVLTVICIVHAYKTGRNSWIYLLIFLPGIGALVYFFLEILPEIRHGDFIPNLKSLLNPNYKVSQWETQLRQTDTIYNRLNLALALEQRGVYPRAIDLVKSCLDDVLYAKDPNILLQLARLYFENGQYAESLTAFEKAWPLQPVNLRKMEDELIYARTLEAGGKQPQAEEIYQRIIRIHHSLEAMYWYGMYLKAQNRREEARGQFQSVREEIRIYPRYARRRYAEWARLSRREMLG